MQNQPGDAGYKWLSETYGVYPVQSFRVRSEIGTGRSTRSDRGFVVNTYPRSYEPAPTLRAHLSFAFKYEGIDLDFLSRFFAAIGPDPVAEWAQQEPVGAYARRCGFLYEWLTGHEISGLGDAGGNYVDLLDGQRYLAASRPEKVRRWRINNNLPGNRDFCPMVALGDLDLPGSAALKSAIEGLVERYGFGTIERAVNWLTVKESRASFEIESEGQEEDRIRRLARAMETHCGRIESALTDEGMLEIQGAIMGQAAKLGLRRSPVFVGHHTSQGQQVIDYLAPHQDDVPRLMDGLREYERRTRGSNPLARAAALSFGFVYIHPLVDGNGRLSRFLINDILRRDGFLPEPLILPVSAVISENATWRKQYDAALERLSRPLMFRIRDSLSFAETKTYPDGVPSNLRVSNWEEGGSTWRYPDLTYQARYLVGVIEHSITHGLKDEAVFLRRYDTAIEGLKEIIEGRDEDYGQIIRSLSQNARITGSLRKTYPQVFEDEKLAAKIERAVLEAFEIIEPQSEDSVPVVPLGTVRPRQR